MRCATRDDTVVTSCYVAQSTVSQRSDHPTVQRRGGVSTREATRYERDRPRTTARRARCAHSPALEAATAPRRQAGGLAAPGGLSLAWVCVVWRGENDPLSGADSICPGTSRGQIQSAPELLGEFSQKADRRPLSLTLSMYRLIYKMLVSYILNLERMFSLRLMARRPWPARVGVL